MHRPRALLVLPAVAAVLLPAGCGSGGTSNSSAGASSSPAHDANPIGDIPDNQVYVPWSPADRSFTVTVPEGWARTDASSGVSFTDKLNTVTVEELSGRPQPSQDSVRGDELTKIAQQGRKVKLGTVETKQLPVGRVLHGTYAEDSAPDPVTGRVTRDDVELYVYWKSGTEVLLKLSGPHGADDVDAWRTVSSSFAWK